MVALILTTKLHIPVLRRNLVPRQRLLERLDGSLHCKLTLISAPAGFGKTTLLGEWIQNLGDRVSQAVKVAWVSLDDGDNDPARFFAYLAASLQQADKRFGQVGGGALDLDGSFSCDSQLVKLLNQVILFPETFVLVLDDYHLITSQVIHDTVTFLIDSLSENLHLILATRADPPLPLPRLRARGHLVELRQLDLRFTTEEAAAFLNSVVGLNLAASDVGALEVRTEGWIAGLQMAALSLQGHSSDLNSRSKFVQTFTGSHRFILDYLVEEVLEQQPAAVQEFLLRTSILDRLTGPLCDSVLGSWQTEKRMGREPEVAEQDHSPPLPIQQAADSQSILEYLEASNLFIVSLDHERRWYRYHRLFSDLLQQRLQRSHPELLTVLHRRASVWHEQRGLMAVAIEHALAAQDFDRAVALIEESVESTLMRSEVATFLNWVERLPDECVRLRPTLCLFQAWALLMRGGPLTSVEQRLQDMACAQDAVEGSGKTEGGMAVLRAYLMLLQADVHSAAALCNRALELLPENDQFLRGIVAWILSLVRLADGDLQDGKLALKELARMSQRAGNPLIAVSALCFQARLYRRQGRLHRAQEILEQALQLATDFQGRRLPIASEALIGLGDLEREWNDLERAVDYLVESIELAKQWSEMATFDAHFPLARVRLAQGDIEAAREALETARQIADMSEATQMDDLVAELQLAHFSTRQGDIAGAARWAQKRGLIPADSSESGRKIGEGQDFLDARLWKYEQLVLARLLILQRQAAAALDVLEAVSTQARALGRVDMTIEIQILRALAYHVGGQDSQAIDQLAVALSLAEPGGYIRTFLDEGEPMADLLRQAASRGLAPEYVSKLLSAFGEPTFGGVSAEPSSILPEPVTEPLSEREMEVLRLLATGMSNPEISEALYIAVSTVRSHLKTIYGKLNVHKRWDAVQRGRELGLI